MKESLFFFSQSYHASWYYQNVYIYQLIHKRTALKRNIKIYIKTAPTCFGLITIIREHGFRGC